MSTTFNPSDVYNAFISWLVEIGLPPDNSAHFVFDDNIHRFRTTRDRAGKANIAYCIDMKDRPYGWVHDHRHDERHSWAYRGANETPWTKEERKQYYEERERHRLDIEEERKRLRALAIVEAGKKWEMATEPDPNRPHSYIKKKKLNGTYGARILGKNLILPLYNADGKVVNVQEIWPDGQKRFHLNAPKRGCFFVIGAAEPLSGAHREVFVCEGFATGASIHEATGRPVVIAWDCGNLEPVIEAVRGHYPGRLVLAPDVDRKTTGNPGMAKAFELAEQFGIPFVFPPFNPDEEGSDWNDYAAIHDVERTAEAIFTALEECRKNPELEKHYAWPKWVGTRNKNGDPKNTKENLEILLEHAGIRMRYDEVKKDLNFTLPVHMDPTGRRFSDDNRQNAFFSLIVSLCEKHNFPTGTHLRGYLGLIADERRFNPVRDWILSRTWDGKDRFEKLCETLQLADWYPDEMKRLLLERWLLSAVAASQPRTDDFKARGVLVLQGAQAIGKTGWFASLVPREAKWLLESATIDPGNKDDLKKVASHWIVELGEVDATFKRSDISRLKGFITSAFDIVRLPFAATFSNFPRRTVFCATVNPGDFLVDTTGNSRWWVLPCLKIDYRHGLDTQQLWAQMYQIYLQGRQWWLTPEEETRLSELNRQFEAGDETEDLIAAKWDWENYEQSVDLGFGSWMNPTMVLKACGMLNPTSKQVRRAGEVLRHLTGKEPKAKGKSGNRCFFVPNR